MHVEAVALEDAQLLTEATTGMQPQAETDLAEAVQCGAQGPASWGLQGAKPPLGGPHAAEALGQPTAAIAATCERQRHGLV